MTTTNVSFTGDIPGAMRRASRPLANDFAVQGLIMLRRNCPVDTGELRESCYARVVERPGQDLGVELGATAPHAVYVEYGTRNMAPRAFIRRTMSQLTRGRR